MLIQQNSINSKYSHCKVKNKFTSDGVKFSGDNINFGNISPKVQNKIMIGACIAALGASHYTFNNMNTDKIIFQSNLFNEKNIMKNNTWGENIRVLASTGQNVLGNSLEPPRPIAYCNSVLLDELEKKEIKTLEQANSKLSTEGYNFMPKDKRAKGLMDILIRTKEVLFYNLPKYPLQTQGPQLNIFNKDEKNKKRYILAFYSNEEKRFSSNSELFTKRMQKIYNIPKENIIMMPLSVAEFDFDFGIDSVMKKINALKNKNKAELLVSYIGHGAAFSTYKGAEKIEGALEGSILGISESDIKNVVKTKLKGIKTLFIFDTCHSGAWISKNGKKVSKKLL